MTVSVSLLNNQLPLTHKPNSHYILCAAIAKKIKINNALLFDYINKYLYLLLDFKGKNPHI